MRHTGGRLAKRSSSNVEAHFTLNSIGNSKPNNSPLPSCLLPLFQSEVKCKTFDMKMALFASKWKSFSH